MKKSSLTRRIGISIFAQIISLGVSFILNLIVPKFIDEYQYAYWQTFLLYVSYAGVLSFGLLDGIILRYSQYDYEQLDKAIVKSQLKVLFFGNCIISCVTFIIACVINTPHTSTTLLLVGIGIITKNQTK